MRFCDARARSRTANRMDISENLGARADVYPNVWVAPFKRSEITEAQRRFQIKLTELGGASSLTCSRAHQLAVSPANDIATSPRAHHTAGGRESACSVRRKSKAKSGGERGAREEGVESRTSLRLANIAALERTGVQTSVQTSVQTAVGTGVEAVAETRFGEPSRKRARGARENGDATPIWEKLFMIRRARESALERAEAEMRMVDLGRGLLVPAPLPLPTSKLFPGIELFR